MSLDWSEMFKLLKAKEQYSAYFDRPVEEQVTHLIDEAQELLEWIKNGNVDNIQEELKDVIMMVWTVTNKLMSTWMLDWFNLESQKDKVFERSPHIKLWEKVSAELEDILWAKAKGNNVL